MHRSGTSFVASAVNSLGFDVGDRLMPSQPDNPKGFFEDLDFFDFNNELLKVTGREWSSVYPITHQDFLLLKDKRYIQSAKDLLLKKLDRVDKYLIKDPRITILLPFWQQVIKELKVAVKYIFTIRNPLAVASSLQTRNMFSLEYGYFLWLQYIITPCQNFDEHDQLLIIDYDNFIDFPDPEYSRLASFLDVKQNSQEIKTFKTNFLDTTLRHNRFSLQQCLESNSCPQIIKDIYQRLKAVSVGEEVFTDLSSDRKLWSKQFDNLKHALKLSEEYQKKHQKSVSELVLTKSSVSDRDQQISVLNQSVSDRDQQISVLNQSVSDRDQQIELLNQALSERDANIENKF